MMHRIGQNPPNISPDTNPSLRAQLCNSKIREQMMAQHQAQQSPQFEQHRQQLMQQQIQEHMLQQQLRQQEQLQMQQNQQNSLQLQPYVSQPPQNAPYGYPPFPPHNVQQYAAQMHQAMAMARGLFPMVGGSSPQKDLRAPPTVNHFHFHSTVHADRNRDPSPIETRTVATQTSPAASPRKSSEKSPSKSSPEQPKLEPKEPFAFPIGAANMEEFVREVQALIKKYEKPPAQEPEAPPKKPLHYSDISDDSAPTTSPITENHLRMALTNKFGTLLQAPPIITPVKDARETCPFPAAFEEHPISVTPAPPRAGRKRAAPAATDEDNGPAEKAAALVERFMVEGAAKKKYNRKK